MKFVTYNIQYGKGKDGRFDIERIAAAVAGADIIALQEVSRYMPIAPYEDQPAQLSALLPEYFWVYGPAMDIDGSETLAGNKVSNRRLQFGNMLLAKTPILTSLVYPLPKHTLTDHPSHQRAAVEGTVQTRDGDLRIYSVHLSPNNPEERRMHVDTLLHIHQEGRAGRRVWAGPGSWFQRFDVPPMPTAMEAVVMGDFNLEPDSEEYTRLTGRIDPVYGRIAASHNLIDTWVRAGNAEDSGVTCPRCVENDTLYDMRIDYGLVSSGLAHRVGKAWIDADAQGSDHQPVWFELDL